MATKRYYDQLPSEIRKMFRVIRPDDPRFIIVRAKQDCFIAEFGDDGPIYIDFDFMD